MCTANLSERERFENVIRFLQDKFDRWVDLPKPTVLEDIRTAQTNLADVAQIKNGKNRGNPKYVYDRTTFPPLVPGRRYGTFRPSEPTTLAEALLWKMSKWPTYLKFIQSYEDQNTEMEGDFIVYDGFAKFLRDNSKPIVDQHSFRAYWAIKSDLTDEQVAGFAEYLLESDDSWSSSGSGDSAAECYQLYTREIARISNGDLEIQGELDRLLMPFGQALKEYSKKLQDAIQERLERESKATANSSQKPIHADFNTHRHAFDLLCGRTTSEYDTEF